MPKENSTLKAVEERLAIQDKLLVEDEAVAKANWYQEYGAYRGFAAAYKAKYDKKVPSKKTHAYRKNRIPRPKILDNKLNEAAHEPDAHCLARVEGGWVVLTYEINGTHCALKAMTKPEGKQFAANRLLEIIKREMV